jgi:hypothetical protein
MVIRPSSFDLFRSNGRTSNLDSVKMRAYLYVVKIIGYPYSRKTPGAL